MAISFRYNPLFWTLILCLMAGIVPTANAEELANPYKLDLREASEKEFKEAIAYGSTLGVTIVVYSAHESPWLIALDAAQMLADDGIQVIIAKRGDNNEDRSDSAIVFVAHKKARQKVRLSTTLKNDFYDFRKKNGEDIKLRDIALSIHREYFVPD